MVFRVAAVQCKKICTERLNWQVSRYLWRPPLNFKIFFSKPLFTIILSQKSCQISVRIFCVLPGTKNLQWTSLHLYVALIRNQFPKWNFNAPLRLLCSQHVYHFHRYGMDTLFGSSFEYERKNPTIFNIIWWDDGLTEWLSRCLMVQCLFW